MSYSEVSQKVKNKYCMLTHIHGILKKSGAALAQSGEGNQAYFFPSGIIKMQNTFTVHCYKSREVSKPNADPVTATSREVCT